MKAGLSSRSYYSGSYTTIDSADDRSWISRFCNRYENSYFCKVDEGFITDSFNLYGIGRDSHLYRAALDVILCNNRSDNLDSEIDKEELETNAEFIYGMVHSRYITTNDGMEAMEQKFKLNVFGSCPRVYCNHQHLLPIGESDNPGVSKVKLFCPCCKEIYFPPPTFSHIDGAFFGTSFPHLFLLQYPEYIKQNDKSFEPKIFGYPIHSSSPYYCCTTPN